MKYITKLKLAAIHQLCDAEDKSTEYMIQFMQDTCKVDFNTVIEYLSLEDKEINRLIKNVNDFVNVFTIIENARVH